MGERPREFEFIGQVLGVVPNRLIHYVLHDKDAPMNWLYMERMLWRYKNRVYKTFYED